MKDVELAEIVALTIRSEMAPVQERLAAAEARLAMLGDVRDRVVTIEAKSMATPMPADAVPEDQVERMVTDLFRKELGIPSA